MPALQLLIFLMMPIISLLTAFSGMVISKRWNNLYALFFSLSLGVFAYNLSPIPEYDLSRYYIIMSDLSTLNLSDAISELSTRLDFASYIMMYAIALTGNYSLLQLIAVTLSYTLILIPLLGIMNKNNFSWKSKAFMTLIFLAFFEFISVYSGVRNYIAISLFFFILYLEFGLGKKIPFFLYFIPALFHISMVIPAIILFIAKINSRSLNRIIGIFFVSIGLLLPAILNQVATSGIAIEIGIAEKVQWYAVDYGAILRDDGYLFSAIIFLTITICTLVVRSRSKIRGLAVSNKGQVFSGFMWMLVLIAVGLLLANKTFFIRYSLLAELIMSLYIINYIRLLSVKACVLIGITFTILAVFSLYKQYLYISLLDVYKPWIEYLLKPFFLILG